MAETTKPLPDEDRLAKFSEAYDRRGCGAELAEIGRQLQLSETQQAELIDEWQGLAGRFRQLRPAKADLAAATISLIQETELDSSVLSDSRNPSTQPARQLETNKSRQLIAKILALVASTAAMLYVAVQVATHETSLNRSAEVLAAFSFDPQGWDVVVVTVSEEQADRLSRDLGDQSPSSELHVLPLLDNHQSPGESLDVVMASKETSEKLLGRLSDDPVETDTEWNPAMVGELDREELLKRFAISMKTPTQSDLFFREVIVVTSDKDSGIRVTSRPTDAGSGSETVVAASGADAGATVNLPREGESVLRQLQNNARRPVLVVFKRRPAKTPDSQGNLHKPPPGFAVYL